MSSWATHVQLAAAGTLIYCYGGWPGPRQGGCTAVQVCSRPGHACAWPVFVYMWQCGECRQGGGL